MRTIMRIISNTGNTVEDVKAEIDYFWKDKDDATEASYEELVNTIIAITTIIDRKTKTEK